MAKANSKEMSNELQTPSDEQHHKWLHSIHDRTNMKEIGYIYGRYIECLWMQTDVLEENAHIH